MSNFSDKHNMGFNISSLETRLVRTPISTPVRTSFGVMHNRPTLIVRVTDVSGVRGYGEVWCNFPVCGAEHRAQLLESEVASRIINEEFDNPEACYRAMTSRLRILRLQTGETGPIAQVIAGVDIAIWDLIAKRNDVPLYALLGAERNQVPAYASGMNPVGVIEILARARDMGHIVFKVKVGFGEQTDRASVDAISANLEQQERFLLDANQGWSPRQALEAIQWIEEHRPGWIEEPMPVDTAVCEWRALKNQTAIPLAGGENFQTRVEYDDVASSKWLDVVQPDIAKWGGFTECLPVARNVVASNLTFCPHSLGGGIALAASAHLLAAAGGPGLLECDVNENGFRDEVFPLDLASGHVKLSDDPGLGVNESAIEKQFA